VLIVAIACAFAEGVVITALIMARTTPRAVASGVLAIGIGMFLLWLSRYADRRVNKHEADRLIWRKGALGEYEVGAELERLSDDFFIFNNVNTEEFGNFDHIVAGPTGVFAIETKNWTGLIEADPTGELTRNGKPSSQPYVRRLEQKLMTLREQILVLCRWDDLFVRGVMVFPKASLAAPFGKTKNIHCLRIEKLRDYIDNTRSSTKLSRDRVAELVRALNGVAGMDVEFKSLTAS